MADERGDVVLFHYPESIHSHRVLWYLQLHGIPYRECIQPGWMPRPDITEGLHLGYRRIPILAIGRDVYCDSRLILDVLAERYGPALTPAQQGIRKLWEAVSMHGGLFWRAAALLPVEHHPFLQQPAFIADRSAMLGRPFTAATLAPGRPEAVAYLRQAYDLLETTFLADGRQWIVDTAGPTLADVDAVWVVQWVVRDQLMAGSVAQSQINADRFPRTFAWIDRFLAAVEAAKAKAPPPVTLSGADAIATIVGSRAADVAPHVDPDEPLGLKVGDAVSVTPTDSGTSHSATGTLRRLTTSRVCIVNDRDLPLHFPRWGFTIERAPPNAPDTDTQMTLIYHPMSPFSRSVFMVAIELGVDHQIGLQKVVVAPVPYAGWSDDNAAVARWNPLAKIPVLVTGGGGIYDSRTIADYLEEVADVSPTDVTDTVRWRLRTLHALAAGLLDAHTLVIYENKIRAERGLRMDAWVDGQKAKIDRALDQLETEASRGTLRPLRAADVATAADVAVAAALAFCDITQHEWRSNRPALSAWFTHWQKRPSFTRTAPDVDWKTGAASHDAFAAGVVVGR